MTDILEAVKIVLERDTGRPVYYEKLPVNGVDEPSYIRIQRIWSHEDMTLTSRTNFHMDRIQVTCIGRTHADLITIVGLMEASMYMNLTDFAASVPLDGSREKYDGANTYTKDFYIQYS
jgi:hypothetical protein